MLDRLIQIGKMYTAKQASDKRSSVYNLKLRQASKAKFFLDKGSLT